MTDAAALARQIQVRHKEDGHLRLDLPPRLTGPAARVYLETGLYRLAGIYRVGFDEAGRRLSIWFQPLQCGLPQVARQLRSLLDTLPAASGAAKVEADTAAVPDPLSAARDAVERGARDIADRARRLLARLKTADAPPGSIQARLQPVLTAALTEKAAINFLNDILMFYLIKVHWDLITKRWMKDPVGHADAWFTTFYLVFLLVRYRKSAK